MKVLMYSLLFLSAMAAVRNDPGDRVPLRTIQAIEGTELVATIKALDNDGALFAGNTLTITIDDLPLGAVFVQGPSTGDPNTMTTGVLTWTPTVIQAGTYELMINCYDISNNSDHKVLTIEVADRDDTPPFLF